MPNVNDQSYAFMAITPIISGRTGGVIHAAELRAVLARLTQRTVQQGSPFAAVPGTHFARWTILDDTPSMGLPTEDDRLQSKYLLFASDIDGLRDPWLEQLRLRMAGELEAIYSHCVAWPGTKDAEAFRRYFVRCQLDTTLGFAPFGTHPRDEILAAIDAQRRFSGFARAMQGRSNAELRAGFREFVRQHRTATAVRPGIA